MRKVGFCLFLALVMCMSTACRGTAADVSESGYGYYEYPITPEDSEWHELGDVSAKIEACRIPQEVLDAMTDEELLQAILDFPFLGDLFVSSQYPQEIGFFEEECDAYREILTRENAKTVIFEKIEVLSNGESVDEEFKYHSLKILLLCSEKFQGQLTEEEREYLEN